MRCYPRGRDARWRCWRWRRSRSVPGCPSCCSGARSRGSIAPCCSCCRARHSASAPRCAICGRTATGVVEPALPHLDVAPTLAVALVHAARLSTRGPLLLPPAAAHPAGASQVQRSGGDHDQRVRARGDRASCSRCSRCRTGSRPAATNLDWATFMSDQRESPDRAVQHHRLCGRRAVPRALLRRRGLRRCTSTAAPSSRPGTSNRSSAVRSRPDARVAGVARVRRAVRVARGRAAGIRGGWRRAYAAGSRRGRRGGEEGSESRRRGTVRTLTWK